jgi:hypothetical protein
MSITALQLMAAEKGGFIVMESHGPGYLQCVMFAGTLSQCLSFMNDYFTPGDKDAPKDR